VPPGVNEPYFSVGPYDAVVECIIAAVAGRPLRQVVDQAAVLGMDEREGTLIARAELVRGHAEETVQLARPHDVVRREIPFPVADVGDLFGLLEPPPTLPQLFLGPLAVGDVANDREMEAGQDVRHGAELGVADGPVLAPHAVLARVLAVLRECAQGRARLRLIPGRSDLQGRHREKLGAVIAEKLGGGRVGVDIPAPVVEEEDGVEGVLEERLQPPARLPERFR